MAKKEPLIVTLVIIMFVLAIGWIILDAFEEKTEKNSYAYNITKKMKGTLEDTGDLVEDAYELERDLSKIPKKKK